MAARKIAKFCRGLTELFLRPLIENAAPHADESLPTLACRPLLGAASLA